MDVAFRSSVRRSFGLQETHKWRKHDGWKYFNVWPTATKATPDTVARRSIRDPLEDSCPLPVHAAVCRKTFGFLNVTLTMLFRTPPAETAWRRMTHRRRLVGHTIETS